MGGQLWAFETAYERAQSLALRFIIGEFLSDPATPAKAVPCHSRSITNSLSSSEAEAVPAQDGGWNPRPKPHGD